MAEDLSSKSFYKPSDMNVDNQVSILTALLKYKPVGVSRHFLMVCIQDIVNNEILNNGGGSASSVKDILLSCDQIWNFLNSLYDLKALEHSEPLPFPNENSEFQLPIGEFGHLYKDRKRTSVTNDKDETSSNPEQITTDSKRKTDRNVDDASSSRSSTPAKKSHQR